MKKVLLFLFTSSLLIKVSAQPTLTAANASPKPGDSYISQSAATTGIGSFAGGANQTWNYANIVDSGGIIAFQAVLPSQTPFADSFPGSNLVIKTLGDSVYIYFNSTTAALLQNGTATNDSTILRYDPARTYLPYPFAYGSTFNGPINEKIPGYDFTFTGTDSISGDGYGTLVLPGRSYNNVLRVKYIENVSFTLDTLLSSTKTNIRVVSYLYYTPDTHAPLLTDATATTSITTSILGFPFFDSTFTSRDISYLKNFVLPVSFQSFKAALQDKGVALQWATAQEINTDHFTIQRSFNGRDFQDVASVKATGGSSGSAYTYVDNNFTNGSVPAAVYYRIKEMDKSGGQTISSIVVVHGNGLTVSVYPNPAVNHIRLFSKDATVADAVALYDAKGRLLQQWNHYSLSQPLNIAGLSQGTYFVKVTLQGITQTTTVIKQ